MGERAEEMATTSAAIATTVPSQALEDSSEPATVITLRPTRKEHRKKVVWTEDTVDNEHMNKKKSKCCCIYEKPHKFGESDSEDSDDECEHCFGHVEKKREKMMKHTAGGATVTVDVQDSASTSAPEPAVTITLQQPEAEQPLPAAPAPPVQPDPGVIQPEHVSS